MISLHALVFEVRWHPGDKGYGAEFDWVCNATPVQDTVYFTAALSAPSRVIQRAINDQFFAAGYVYAQWERRTRRGIRWHRHRLRPPLAPQEPGPWPSM